MQGKQEYLNPYHQNPIQNRGFWSSEVAEATQPFRLLFVSDYPGVQIYQTSRQFGALPRTVVIPKAGEN